MNSRSDLLKITMFWSFVIAILFFFIDSILAIAKSGQGGIIACFVIAMVFTVIGGGIWLWGKIKKTNRKITA